VGRPTPIRLSDEDILIAVCNPKGNNASTNIFARDALTTTMPGWAVGWLPANNILLNLDPAHIQTQVNLITRSFDMTVTRKRKPNKISLNALMLCRRSRATSFTRKLPGRRPGCLRRQASAEARQRARR